MLVSDASIFLTVAISLQYMKEHLVTRYHLDLSVGEKPVMNVDNLYIVLHHHWTKEKTPHADGRQITQLAFLLLVSAYTGIRPGRGSGTC